MDTVEESNCNHDKGTAFKCGNRQTLKGASEMIIICAVCGKELRRDWFYVTHATRGERSPEGIKEKKEYYLSLIPMEFRNDYIDSCLRFYIYRNKKEVETWVVGKIFTKEDVDRMVYEIEEERRKARNAIF